MNRPVAAIAGAIVAVSAAILGVLLWMNAASTSPNDPAATPQASQSPNPTPGQTGDGTDAPTATPQGSASPTATDPNTDVSPSPTQAEPSSDTSQQDPATDVVDVSDFVPVADVQGLTVRQAARELRAQGLVPFSLVTQDTATATDVNQVQSSLPSPDLNVEPGSRVQLFVPAYTEQAPTPDLGGLPAEQAVAAVWAAGLRVGSIVVDEADGATPGTVFAQFPAPGEEADVVTLAIASGKKATSVPDVQGTDFSLARFLLLSAGLDVASTDVPVGAVVAGATVPPDLMVGGKVELVFENN